MLGRMFYRGCMFALILWCTAPLHAQQGRPTSMPAATAMGLQELAPAYRRALETTYSPATAETVHQATLLLDRYFSQPDTRAATLASIRRLGLDANILGKLTQIRPTWPALQPGVYYINEKQGPSDVRYFLGIPRGYDRIKSWPLVIKLPTADAFVGDPMPDPAQATQIYSDWIMQELANHPQAIVLMPLLNLDVLWGPSYQGMDNVILPMQHAAGRANIDPARVYMLGHSMSAHAAWNLALHYPTYFASFSALAGGAAGDWQRLRMMNLRNTLPVVWHDANDEVIPPDSSRQLIRLLQTLKLNVDYNETRNLGHVPTAQVAERAYATMITRTRELYPKQVSVQSNRPDTMFNRNDWVQIYQPVNPGPEQRLLFTRGTGYMRVYSGSYSIDATIANNVITVNSRNVSSMRFYVNDQMIDFSRAVSVVVNRRQRFEAILKPDLDQMLKDQVFLGRGWRYYTGVIDIDFGATERPTTRSN